MTGSLQCKHRDGTFGEANELLFLVLEGGVQGKLEPSCGHLGEFVLKLSN